MLSDSRLFLFWFFNWSCQMTVTNQNWLLTVFCLRSNWPPIFIKFWNGFRNVNLCDLASYRWDNFEYLRDLLARVFAGVVISEMSMKLMKITTVYLDWRLDWSRWRTNVQLPSYFRYLQIWLVEIVRFAQMMISGRRTWYFLLKKNDSKWRMSSFGSRANSDKVCK